MPSSRAPPPPPIAGAKVAVVVLENRGPQALLRSGWLATAARRGGRAVNAYGEVHPSLGNYLALISGSTQGVSDDSVTDGPFSAPTIAGQLQAAGLPWRAYFDGLPAPCFGRTRPLDQTGRYAKRHNPFLFFTEVITDVALCQDHIVPGAQLAADERQGLGRFVWVTPNLCEDIHDCPVSAGQRWMAHTLPPLIRALGPEGILFVTTDEGTDDAHGGGRVPLVVLGGGVRRGAILRTPVDHRAVLASIEDALGLPRLATTRHVPTLRALLRG